MNMVIYGLGRIGLPIALVCAESGYNVTGIDINKTLINSLHKGELAFDEPGMKQLLQKHLNTSFHPKHQEEDIVPALKQAEYIMLAVGTGFAKYPEKPKLSTLYSIIGQLITTGLKDKTLILRVTLPIGTSDDIVHMIQQKTGLKEGKDFFFGFVPERIMEGKAITEERSLPKIIGCYHEQGFNKVGGFFKKIGGELIRVSNPKTAEFIKLIDNSWRNTRFAFANELAYLADDQNIDVMEAINSANQGYERNQIPRPGPVSGYCLGKDPYLLEHGFSNVTKQRGFGSTFFYGRRANDWFIDNILRHIRGKTVLIAGLSFKENIDDYRYSHSIDLVHKLLEKQYTVIVCDPYLNQNAYTQLPKESKEKVKIETQLEKALKLPVDTIIICTRHNEFLNVDLSKATPTSNKVTILDLWNIYPQLKDQTPAHIMYKGFGRP